MLEAGKLGLRDDRVLNILPGRSRGSRMAWPGEDTNCIRQLRSEGHVRPRIFLHVVYPARSYALPLSLCEGDGSLC